MSRHSVKNALRLARAARGAVSRAELRYAKQVFESYWLRHARALINAAEADLCRALRGALDKADRTKTRRAA